jgi:C1A family cysteine protease
VSRRYGRKIPAPLPAHRMLQRSTPSLPQSVDLRQFCGAIKNQGDLGSCTGHAFASAIEWICRAYLGKQPTLSPLYLYAHELIMDGDFPDDDGSDGTTGSLVSIKFGCCEDSLYPDASHTIQQPTPAMDSNAEQYQMGAYHGLTGSQTALSVLGDPVPWPVEVGFTVYSSFESDEVAQTGIYNPNPASETVLGGHEVLAVGYDVASMPTLRPANCPPALLIQNSWAASWGLSGFFWMALPVVDDPQTDLKIVHSGSPW